jgi:hypothetical protein
LSDFCIKHSVPFSLLPCKISCFLVPGLRPSAKFEVLRNEMLLSLQVRACGLLYVLCKGDGVRMHIAASGSMERLLQLLEHPNRRVKVRDKCTSMPHDA